MAFLRILLLLLVTVLMVPSLSSAQDTSISDKEQEETGAEIVATDPAELEAGKQNQQSEYVLPYPGMLPNNPLYFFKSLRDSFIGFIISDPLKKAEFELLQSDKKLVAAQFLLKEGENPELALSSVEESATHAQMAFDRLVQTEVKSTDSQAVFQKMAASFQKHHDVLMELSETTRNDAFIDYAEKASALAEKADSYL